MKAEYLEAVETKLNWLRKIEQGGMRWPDAEYYNLRGQRLKADAARIKEANLYGNLLKYGEVVYVGPEFCDMLEDIVPTMPDLSLQKQWLPTRTAFIYFARDIRLPYLAADPTKTPFAMRAMGYLSGEASGPLLEGTDTVAAKGEWGEWSQMDTNVEPDRVNSIWSATFQTRGVGPGWFWPLSFFSWRTGTPLSQRIAEYEAEAAPSQGNYASTERHEIRYMAALLQLLHQKLLVAPRAKLLHDRAARRRAEKEGWQLDESIRVVTLRRTLVKPGTGDSRPVDWKVRWWVGGHWRKQWYPSLETHVNVYIAPYVKGPQDRPFKETNRMFAAVR